MMRRVIIAVSVATLLAGCSSKPEGRYHIAQDRAPLRTPTPAELVDPIPRVEAHSRQGNAPYTLFGQRYEILETAEGYEEEGIASWYGQKFHGHLTSNGEFFDMFSMTAAHKTLPLPTYARVTNLDNGHEVIVRINDRGPFHDNRIIDLSYAAAYRLGVAQRGTARVRVKAITPAPAPLLDTVQAPQEALFIQVAAARNPEHLAQLQSHLQEIYPLSATTHERDGLHRLLLGPLSPVESAKWLETLRDDGHSGVFRVSLPYPFETSKSNDETPEMQSLESTEVH
ncbi:MAG: septal ring lytic transglycosylase RlpA family protein [Idiomarina sp.]|nr:septal ring lytic transglycosylase RlpA family protein [Idiomarina sp.]